MRQYLSATLFFVLISLISNAQTDSTEKTKGAQFKISINYNSHLNYYGRTDSLKSSGMFPLAELWLGEDFYINAAPVFVNNALQSFDYAGTITTLGYLHSGDKWITSLYVLKPFYKESSQLVQSALKAQAGASFTKLSNILNVTAGGDVKWSDKIDFGVTAGVDHIFRKQLKDNSVLVVDPSFYVYAGTQNFTNTYNRKKTGSILMPGNTEQVTQTIQRLNVLAYEASLPLIYARGKWLLMVTPTYVVPQNIIQNEEKGAALFYTTAALKYTF